MRSIKFCLPVNDICKPSFVACVQSVAQSFGAQPFATRTWTPYERVVNAMRILIEPNPRGFTSNSLVAGTLISHIFIESALSRINTGGFIMLSLPVTLEVPHADNEQQFLLQAVEAAVKTF